MQDEFSQSNSICQDCSEEEWQCLVIENISQKITLPTPCRGSICIHIKNYSVSLNDRLNEPVLTESGFLCDARRVKYRDWQPPSPEKSQIPPKPVRLIMKTRKSKLHPDIFLSSNDGVILILQELGKPHTTTLLVEQYNSKEAAFIRVIRFNALDSNSTFSPAEITIKDIADIAYSTCSLISICQDLELIKKHKDPNELDPNELKNELKKLMVAKYGVNRNGIERIEAMINEHRILAADKHLQYTYRSGKYGFSLLGLSGKFGFFWKIFGPTYHNAYTWLRSVLFSTGVLRSIVFTPLEIEGSPNDVQYQFSRGGFFTTESIFGSTPDRVFSCEHNDALRNS